MSAVSSHGRVDRPFFSHLLVLLASVLVAGSFIASDHLAGQVNPISLTLLRFVVASLLLTPFVFRKGSRFSQALFRQILATMPRAMLLSFFYAVFFIGMFEALTLTSTLNTATLYTLVPFITALIAAVLLKENMTLLRALAYLLGAVGTLWVIFKGDMAALLALQLNHGDWIFLLASLSMCLYSVSMKYFYRNDDLWLFVWCILIGAAIWMSMALILFEKPLDWTVLDQDAWIDVAYLAIGTTLFTAYLYQRSTISLGPSAVTAYVYLNPALVALLAFFVEGNAIDMVIIPGVVLSVLSMFFLLRSGVTRSH